EVSLKKPGVTARVMPSFLRFGSAQLAAKRQGPQGLVRLARFALGVLARTERAGVAAPPGSESLPPPLRESCFFGSQRSCAHEADALSDDAVLRCLLERTVQRTAALVAAWMAVGFAHGVMNTDNLSLLGLTVDLNVYGFLSKYDPAWAPNHIDDTARYAFGAQPEIAKWNLERLSDALTGTAFVMDREPDAGEWHQGEEWLDKKSAQLELTRFQGLFQKCYVARMELRLGLAPSGAPCVTSGSSGCTVRRWLRWLEASGADYVRASRGLAEASDADALAAHAGADPAKNAELKEILADLSKLQGEHWRELVRARVPVLAPRSHVLQEAARMVEMEKPGAVVRGFLQALQQLLREPFDLQPQVLTAAHDDPRSFWRGRDLSAESLSEQSAERLREQLKERLSAMPPQNLQQIRTSCGAQ
ncbi:unnamed protein product, partial [Effrenium voratum]